MVEVRWSRAIASPARSVLLDELESELFALHPTSGLAADLGLAVEIDLVDPTPSASDFEYGVRRLLRVLRQWNRRLIPCVVAYVGVGERRYVIPLGGAPDDPAHPERLNHETLIADFRRHGNESGDCNWANGWQQK